MVSDFPLDIHLYCYIVAGEVCRENSQMDAKVGYVSRSSAASRDTLKDFDHPIVERTCF